MADFIYIPEMAKLLDTTEAGIRGRIRQGGDLPEITRIGIKRIGWTRKSYNLWLKSKQPKTERTNEQTNKQE